MGCAPAPIARHENGAPIWPEGIRGSIAHASGAWCALCAFADRYKSLGIDIEDRNRLVSDQAMELFVNPAEAAWLKKLFYSANAVFRMAVFSAKESVYKLLSPIAGSSVSYDSFSILPIKSEGAFSAIINEKVHADIDRGMMLHGRIFINNSWVVTVASL